MKAVQLNQSGKLLLAEVDNPIAGPGQILIKVHAAGVTRPELTWYPTTHTPSGEARTLPVPSHEFSGEVAALGDGVNSFAVGDRVYGMNDWFQDGGTAEYCLTIPSSITASPAKLTPAEAATVPISALTAWQGLFEQAGLQPGQRVLVHGGAGSVGLFAVQLAHLHGAHVVATTSARNLDFTRKLGADQVIDYHAERFEDLTGAVDIVFDTVGGETRKRSRSVLKANGHLVAIAGDEPFTPDPKIREAFFIVEPNQKQLAGITKMLDDGRLRTFVKAVVPLKDAAMAYTGNVEAGRSYGKVVVAIE
jgi:NADPH:quinone reductase-like Zn-dependent oxidoreductase